MHFLVQFQSRTMQGEQLWPVTECFGLSKKYHVCCSHFKCLSDYSARALNRQKRAEILTSVKEHF